jgi:hypothetical protein
MSQAFEVTNTDLTNVLRNTFNMNLNPDSDQANRVMDRLDIPNIERAALDADIGSMTDDEEILSIQTTAAYGEIARQLQAFKLAK